MLIFVARKPRGWQFLVMAIFFLSSLLSTFLFADSPSQPLTPIQWREWESVKQLYDAGKYNEALNELSTHPKEIASYYYNLGTIYFQLNQAGKAVAFLEKANRLDFHDSDININLRIARQALSQLIGKENVDPASTWTESIADRLTATEVRGGLSFGVLVFIILLFQAYVRTRNIFKALLKPAGVIGFAGFVVTLGIYGIYQMAGSSPPAICTEHEVVRSGPGERFSELGKLESGAKVRVLETVTHDQQAEIWQQIRFSQDGIGWVRASHLLLL